jgi:hypothetical protein
MMDREPLEGNRGGDRGADLQPIGGKFWGLSDEDNGGSLEISPRSSSFPEVYPRLGAGAPLFTLYPPAPLIGSGTGRRMGCYEWRCSKLVLRPWWDRQKKKKEKRGKLDLQWKNQREIRTNKFEELTLLKLEKFCSPR